ncbi:hypothetical protein IQ07DRAFT_375575 [Pyrenochaeta sp. DS3sAY3a]|nr:hypothetical protein IQ07DRAFT_375575 [Pyrenochaeta sp. DS3sAY3a]
MAEGPERDMQLAMEHIPSRLRNEIRPSPSETDGLLEEDAVARPLTHFVSLENQRREPEGSTSSKQASDTKPHNQSDDDFDPEARAVLRSTKAIKVDTMPIIFKMLQRPGSSDSTFVFGRPKDSRDKPSANNPLEVSRFTIQESPSTAPVLVAEPASTHDDASITTSTLPSLTVQHENDPNAETSHTRKPDQETIAIDEMPLNANTGADTTEETSCVPTPVTLARKPENQILRIRIKRPRKKNKRVPTSQQSARAWPLLSSPNVQLSRTAEFLNDVSATRESKLVDQPKPLHEQNKDSISTIDGVSQMDRVECASVTNTSALQPVDPSIVADIPSGGTRHPSSSPPIESSHGNANIDRTGNHLRPESETSDLLTVENPCTVNHESTVLLPDRQSRNTSEILPTANRSEKQFRQIRTAEDPLHRVSTRGGSHRVSKSPPRGQFLSTSPGSNGNGRRLPPSIDECLEALRTSLLTEHLHTQKENEKDESTIALLQEKIRSQRVTIEKWRTDCQNLRVTVACVSEKAKSSQKYVVGLQKDAEKLQRAADICQNNNRALQDTVARIEAEKRSLEEEFHKTVDALTARNQTWKQTSTEIFMQLKFLQSEKLRMLETIRQQDELCKQEKSKCDQLETQLLSIMQDIRSQLGSRSMVLSDQLQQLQDSVNEIPGNDHLITSVKECSDILRGLQATPYLTPKNVQKAERMFILLRKRVDNGFENAIATAQGTQQSTNDIQAMVKDQFQDIRNELVKYEEVVAENQKAQELSAHLREQLGAQQEHSRGLENQVESLKFIEANLKARSDQLESELNDLRNASHEPESGAELAVVQEAFAGLQQHVKKTEDELRLATNKADQHELVQLKLQKEVDEYKDRWEKCKERLQRINNQEDKNKMSASDLRQSIAKEYEKNASNLRNNVHQLSVKLKESEENLRDQRKEAGVAKDRLQTLQKDMKAMEVDLIRARKEKGELKTRLQNAQLSASEATGLTEVRQKLIQELCDESRIAQEETKKLKTERQNLMSQLDVSRASEATSIETCNELHVELENLRQLVIELQFEKESEEFDSALMQAGFEDNLRQLAIKLQSAKESEEFDSALMQVGFEEDKKQCELNHCAEIQQWSSRLTKAETGLQHAHTEKRRLEDEHKENLRCHREYAEKRLKEVTDEYERKIHDINMQIAIQTQQSSRDVAPERGLLQALHITQSTSLRKKVVRQNHSIPDRTEPIVTRAEDLEPSLGTVQVQDSLQQDEEPYISLDDLFQSDLESVHGRDGGELPVLGSVLEVVPETPAKERPGMLFEAAQSTDHGSPGSSELSTVDSEEMTQLQEEAQRPPTPFLRGHDRSPSKLRSELELGTSFDRPKSQANTASRMMPPPDNVTPRSHKLLQVVHDKSKSKSVDTTNESMGRYRSGASSPDFMHPLSTSKNTYTQLEVRHPSDEEPSHVVRRPLDRTGGQKRKGMGEPSTAQNARHKSSRRHENASPAASANDPRSSSPSSTRTPSNQLLLSPLRQATVASRSQSQLSMSGASHYSTRQNSSTGGSQRSRSQHFTSYQSTAVSPRRHTPSRATTTKGKLGFFFQAPRAALIECQAEGTTAHTMSDFARNSTTNDCFSRGTSEKDRYPGGVFVRVDISFLCGEVDRIFHVIIYNDR